MSEIKHVSWVSLTDLEDFILGAINWLVDLK